MLKNEVWSGPSENEMRNYIYETTEAAGMNWSGRDLGCDKCEGVFISV